MKKKINLGQSLHDRLVTDKKTILDHPSVGITELPDFVFDVISYIRFNFRGSVFPTDGKISLVHHVMFQNGIKRNLYYNLRHKSEIFAFRPSGTHQSEASLILRRPTRSRRVGILENYESTTNIFS